jgi:surface polysaccharide O-acyltransferase-like enzyme
MPQAVTAVPTPHAQALAETPASNARPIATRWMDSARVAAMVAVVLIHVLVPAVVVDDAGETDTAGWWFATFLSSASRFCVPLFIMLSGALLLDAARPTSARAFYQRRLRRIGVPLLVWTLFYLAFRHFYLGTADDVQDATKSVAAGSPYYHLYFLFVLAGLYALTPFLRVVTRHSPMRLVAAFAAMLLVLGMADQALSVFLAEGQLNAVTRFLPYAGYFVAGWCLCRVPVNPRGLRIAAVAFVVSAVGTTVGTWALILVAGWGDVAQFFFGYLSPLVVVMSLASFVLLRAAAERLPAVSGHRIVRRLSELSLGVYLVHPALLAPVKGMVQMPDAVLSLALTVSPVLALVLAASLAITAIAQRLPYIRAAF